MSSFVEPAATVSETWIRTLEHVVARDGGAVNVICTVEDPRAPEDPQVRAAIDGALAGGNRKDVRIQPVETVAGTIFPAAIYANPGISYAPQMHSDELARLDASASNMFAAYLDMLPILITDRANRRGTYFGRMVSWPGRTGGGTNQLADRIERLRRSRDANHQRRNLEDLVVGGEADALEVPTGLQVLAASDRRERGFPCLVHVDLTLSEGKLSMAATYRHQFLVTKAYGNLLGLSRLLCFIAQQSGYDVGELLVNATYADAEQGTYTRRGLDDLIQDARSGS